MTSPHESTGIYAADDTIDISIPSDTDVPAWEHSGQHAWWWQDHGCIEPLVRVTRIDGHLHWYIAGRQMLESERQTLIRALNGDGLPEVR